MPKILLFDIETSMFEAAVFQPSINYIPYTALRKEWTILSAAWKWEGLTKIQSCTAMDEGKHDDDRNVVLALHKALQESDAIVGHNSDKFDLKKFNVRNIYHGLPPIKPLIQIDTLKIAKKHFRFTWNRLDYLGDFLGVGRKIHTEPGLWDRCMAGDPKAFKKMERYNRGDVSLLERVYEKLKPYEPAKFNYNLISDEHVCPSCGSENIIARGVRHLKVTTVRRYSCNDCRAWHQRPDRGLAR